MKVSKGLRWPATLVVVGIPIAIAASSPLLQYREPVYIVAGFAGILAMALLLIQPLLLTSVLPGATGRRGRKIHLWVGIGLLITVVVHVVGLWITSPPDVVDALLFRSPTQFSIWGVIAMWSVLAAAILGIFRRRLAIKAQVWRLTHTLVTSVVVIGTVIHALEIDGAMGTVSKLVMSGFVLLAMIIAVIRLRSWMFLKRRTSRTQSTKGG